MLVLGRRGGGGVGHRTETGFERGGGVTTGHCKLMGFGYSFKPISHYALGLRFGKQTLGVKTCARFYRLTFLPNA